MPFRADLHCHSTHSDGTLSPEELVRLAVATGLKGLSITDHDTITAYEAALPTATEMGLLLLPGVEFSAVHKHANIHILGYAYDINSEAIDQLCKRHSLRRSERNNAILEKLKSHNFPMTLDDIPQSEHSTGRPHIAQAMVNLGYVSSIQEAFQKYLGDDKPCYVRTASISVEETIETIHQAKGFAVIAHPHLIQNNKILKEILEMPFDGIECTYGNFPTEKNQQWVKIAQKKKWMMTGGSDFHGSIRPQIPLGVASVGEELFQTLYTHFRSL